MDSEENNYLFHRKEQSPEDWVNDDPLFGRSDNPKLEE